MVVRALCVQDKKKHKITDSAVIKLQKTKTGMKAQVIGYNPKFCKTPAGAVKMATYIKTAPGPKRKKSCPKGQMRNPLSHRCNSRKTIADNILSYSSGQKRKMISKARSSLRSASKPRSPAKKSPTKKRSTKKRA